MLLVLSFVVFLHLRIANTTPRIVIVGAGPAGVAAATRLLHHGYKNITVLEAENRIGGRINSVFFGGAYVDLGAEWCHGEKNNIVYELVKDFQILRKTPSTTKLYHSSGKTIDDQFSEELVNLFKDVYNPNVDRAEAEGVTLGHYIVKKYNSTIHEKFGQNVEKLEVAKHSIDHLHHTVLSFEGAFSWFEPSALNDYTISEGEQNLNWNGLGYKTILDVLTRKFPDPSKQIPFDDKVQLNKEVMKIEWTDSSSVTATCSDGSTFKADHLIFTPSIGVLKERHEKMFYPHLSDQKKEAIKQIGFGAVMKVPMYYRDRWWGSNLDYTCFIWSDNDRDKLSTEFPGGPRKDNKSWLNEFYAVISAENNPNVLIAWFTGDLVPEIEVISNETLIHGITFVLNKFLGYKYNITKPDSIMRTSWHTNPHFRGSYSFQSIEARKSNVTAEMELGKPLLNAEGRPIVLFAGEASHPYRYSTVHGAIETGYREADRIIDIYK